MKKILKIVLPSIGVVGLIRYCLLGITTGLFNFLFINGVTRILGKLSEGSLKAFNLKYLGAFVLIIILIIGLRKIFSSLMIKLSQKVFWQLRRGILQLVLKAKYRQLVLNKDQIHAVILGDIYVLTEASMSIVGFFTSLILSISCLIYLASISFILFLLTIITSALGIIVYYLGSKKSSVDFENARNLEHRFVISLDEILGGFKEIYMGPEKGKAIYSEKIIPVSEDAIKSNVLAYSGFLNNQITGQILFYILITTILMVFSIILNIKSSEIVSFIFTLLYLLNSIETIMVLLPALIKANVAADHLMDLKDDLEYSVSDDNPRPEPICKEDFLSIKIKDLEFSYAGQSDPFKIGPIDFSINKGDVIFIYGGNGSGKTTFLYSVLGLNEVKAGTMWLNDILIEKARMSVYRSAFAVVFSDFYLFKEFYGLKHFDADKWNYYLKLFELNEKVKINENSFSTVDLSAGQKKRLALIGAILENKPIIVMDEWAADQDPYFRQKFYMQIIPILKSHGFTVIAITHDDKYYHCADKLYKMDFGTLQIASFNGDVRHFDNKPLEI
ncbi:cyclic peptide export ABC transporter [Mucilaginibacter lappiensis]|uniref:Putative ATP-binding cassette transporter n=1 Tax=Mucilaginibacter lappiensis TaxID=354630 RepID=A0A841JHB5_9SPHI|nr:cyclic peptide export ABC transporter [Mucilaginibacter lappiensis]MBB6127421.1 putative ATP-binding cassette transporter [Mucilaginibacter lappiensis]